MASTFRLEGPLMANLDGFDEKAQRAMVAGAGLVSTELQAYMRTNARWTDRTGNARSGLTSVVRKSHDKVAIVLFHRVPYGPFLEVRWGGKYGIINDTINYGSPRFVEIVGRLLFS